MFPHWDQAVEVAKNAAKSITDAQTDESAAAESEPDAAAAEIIPEEEEEEEGKNDILRSSALDRLEKASQDTLLGQASHRGVFSYFIQWLNTCNCLRVSYLHVQGLKVVDHSVESFASGAWLALGSALKGGSSLVHKYGTINHHISSSV